MSARAPNPTAASLLGFLHNGPMSGWDLAAVAETVIGDFWSLTRSQVYRELERMAADGLVEPGEPEARNRRPFAITDAGREAFRRWLADEPGREQIRFPLLLTVAFGGNLSPERLQEFVARHREIHAARLARYEQQHAEAEAAGDAADAYVLATLEFGLIYERAVMAWFDGLPDLLPDWPDS